MATATSPPPSPLVSPPGLLQSSSSSTADPPTNKPQLSPHTPPRGRSRYPSGLAHGGPRVPLHRRGTSKTYERLEDLLQEAGYKETRVFTPETERHRDRELGQGERRQMDGRVRSGMDTVVGFLAGLVLGQSDSQPADTKDSPNEHMVRASPSSQQPRPSSSHGPITNAPLLQTRGPLRSDGTTYERSSAVLASPARAYLRHIASAPNIPRRRLPGEHAPPPTVKKSTTSLKDGLNAQGSPPPMPSSWLETVTRAVLGFHDAHIRRNDKCLPRAIQVWASQPSREPFQYSSREWTIDSQAPSCCIGRCDCYTARTIDTVTADEPGLIATPNYASCALTGFPWRGDKDERCMPLRPGVAFFICIWAQALEMNRSRLLVSESFPVEAYEERTKPCNHQVEILDAKRGEITWIVGQA
ncbi:hypothetical protein EDB86DRAFT_1344460 [Lactarius hatsudake]|nr:hypothetical protein EDB86DRAFT_1344460 [Lactarius hatsudake]